jgi:hypothetical protein
MSIEKETSIQPSYKSQIINHDNQHLGLSNYGLAIPSRYQRHLKGDDRQGVGGEARDKYHRR